MANALEPPHPSGRELTEFERRLCRLRLIGHAAHQLICALTRTEDRKQDEQLLFTLQNYSLILICRFLEIWAQFQALAKENRRVLEIARAISPYLDRINIWPGLTEYRNWILAHRYQIKDEPEFIPPWTVIQTGRVPSETAERMLLLDCVQQASAATMAYFGAVYRSLMPVLTPTTPVVATKGVSSGEAAQAERIQMARRTNELLAALQVDLNDPVFAEFKCRPGRQPSNDR